MEDIKLAMSEALLARLIAQGHICAADIKCLDSESKQRVWQLCLWACKHRICCNKVIAEVENYNANTNFCMTGQTLGASELDSVNSQTPTQAVFKAVLNTLE